MPTQAPYVKISDSIGDHYKFDAAGPLALAVYVQAVGYCKRQITQPDGHFPAVKIAQWLPGHDHQTVLADMLEARLLHAPNHGCERCEPVREGWLCVHGYLDWQTSGAQRRARSESARAAVKVRWERQSSPPDTERITERTSGRNTEESRGEDRNPPRRHGRRRSLDDLAQCLSESQRWPIDHCRRVLIEHRQVLAARPGTRNPDAILATIVDDSPAELPAPAQERPTTTNHCGSGDCPGGRHTWSLGRNRFMCMGDE